MAAAAATVLLAAILRERRDARALLFCGLTATFGVYAFARAIEAPHWSLAALTVLGSLVAASAASLAGNAPLPRAYGPALFWVPMALGASVGLDLLPAAAPLALATTWLAAGVAFGARALSRAAHADADGESPRAARQRYLSVALAIVGVAIAIDVVARQLGGAQIAGYIAALFYLYAGYLHLARVRVQDLRQLMGTTVSLSLMAAGLSATFALLWLWVGPRLDAFVFNAFVTSFVLLLFLEPTRVRVQSAMDRYFVASRLELERTFGPLIERLSHIVTLDAFLSEVLETAEHTSRLRASAIFLREDPLVGFQLAGSFGLRPRRRVNLMREPDWVDAICSGEPIQIDELEKALRHPRPNQDTERTARLHRTMQELDAQLTLPLRSENQVVGFWTLSDVRTREPFSTSEIQLLRKVADQMATTIETSRTFERVRARDRLAMMGEMSTGLAHEIRNPLATIRGAIPLLEDEDPARSAEIRKMMIEEIERLDRLVEIFLNYARPSTERAVLHDLGGFVRGCVASVQRSRADAEVELVLDLARQTPDVFVNADQLERVVTNVVQNAYEAIDDKGRIEVAVRPASDPKGSVGFLEIRVRDSGGGFGEEALERAFIPFFTTKARGTGLGLPLCERLLRAEGGEIQIKSDPGEMTEVTIRLPVRSPASDGPSVPQAGGESAP